MKNDRIIMVQHFGSTNETRREFADIDGARRAVYACMSHNPLAQYSLYRKSTSRLLVQWELGKLTINNVRGEMGHRIAVAGGAVRIGTPMHPTDATLDSLGNLA